MTGAAGGAAAASAGGAAQVIQAIRASGVIIHVEPVEFLRILDKHEEPLVVHCEGGIFWTTYQYITTYKGLAFYTKDKSPITLPPYTELVIAKRIWVP
ncbi:MAG: hypothetical protein ACYS8W_17410 [Planctomycetota bacterium]|jgi:hypothetical protein